MAAERHDSSYYYSKDEELDGKEGYYDEDVPIDGDGKDSKDLDIYEDVPIDGDGNVVDSSRTTKISAIDGHCSVQVPAGNGKTSRYKN
jgi:hypothetical protein